MIGFDAYTSGAFKTAAACWAALAESDELVHAGERAWIDVLVALAGGLEALMIGEDRRGGAALLRRAHRLASAAPDAGADLDVAALRRALAKLSAIEPAELPVGAPLEKGLAPRLVLAPTASVSRTS